MGIIAKSHRNNSPPAAGSGRTANTSGTTLIAANSTINGSFTLSDNLHIDGRIEGDIVSDADVTIGEQGHFEGTIKAVNIIVCGHMDGNIECQRLEIIANGHVNGELLTDDLVIESGGRFIGQSKIRTDNTVQLIGSSSKNTRPDTESGKTEQVG